MRITGGRAKGILIKAPRSTRVRPTSDKVRESLFNVLGDTVSAKRVLDLFAGSGALGIEALSRGAAHAVLVEKDRAAARTIGANLAKAGLVEKAEVLRTDFRSAIRKLSERGDEFDLIFLDPPYEGGLLEQVANILAEYRLTSGKTVIVAEHFKKITPPPAIAGFPLTRTRTYGQTALSYFQSGPADDIR